LSCSEWTHEAHIRLAWLMLDSMPYSIALDRIRAGINNYNDSVLKKANAYHETITVVFTHLIAAGREQLLPNHTFAEFKPMHPALFDRKLSALLRHYRHETLFSSEARVRFVSPDLLPLPVLMKTKDR
jgi:hypothetical protein